jgi:hypothetical protein
MFSTHSCESESVNALDARQQRVTFSELIQDISLECMYTIGYHFLGHIFPVGCYVIKEISG